MDKETISLPGEIWKPDILLDFDGIWLSSLGRVWQDAFTFEKVRLGKRICIAKPATLRSQSEINGYRVVMITRNGVARNRYVNRLVCAAFHGPPPSETYQSAHWNGIRNDNRQENLRWATCTENLADRKRHGTDVLGEGNPRAIITEKDVLAIRAYPPSRFRVTELSAKYGLSRSGIYDVLSRRSWVHI